MSLADAHQAADGREWLLWSACGAIALTIHAATVLAIARQSDEPKLEAGAPVVMMELAPISAAPPTPLSEVAPGRLQAEAQRIEQVRQVSPHDQMAAVQVPPSREDPLVSVQSGATVLSGQKPQTEAREVPPIEAREEIHQEAAVATAPPSAVEVDVRPAAPAPGLVERPTSAALVTWERLMAMQLERHKRYPPQAQGQQGEATLAFTIDRHGRLLSSRIIRSAGSPVLDAAALDLLSRAQPFPEPPAGIADAQLSITVPIRYSASAKR
jgi:protein TonB